MIRIVLQAEEEKLAALKPFDCECTVYFGFGWLITMEK
jgi:hypothetical protein